MKIVSMSCSHLVELNNPIPEGDVFIHAGDFCNTGCMNDVMVFSRFLANLPHKYKIIVPGNHDRIFEYHLRDVSEMLFENSTNSMALLIDDFININGVIFYGSPWQLPFNNWAFNLPEDQLKEKFAAIKKNTNVLITHSPPYGILDLHLGSKELLNKVKEVKPKYHLFGHIHEDGGRTYENKSTTFANICVLDETYKEKSPCFVFEI